MESNESKLFAAALEGNTTTLRGLLEQDRLILDKVIFLNHLSHKTPLHVAAFLGHGDFVKEILEVNPDMCLARDADGRNPLHLAAMKGRIDVLKEMVRVRPLAASVTTLCGETILHLCVKHRQLEALKLLLENSNELHHLLNSKDDYGTTILHLAVADKQMEAIQLILTTGKKKIEVNSLNANGFTPLGILALSKGDEKIPEIERLLGKNKAISAIEQDGWSDSMRSAILVVASLIATVAFQAVVNPPPDPPERGNPYPSVFPGKASSQSPGPSAPDLISYSSVTSSWIEKPFFALKDTFAFFNSVAFLASVSTILMLISGLPLKRKVVIWVFMIIMWAAITAMTFTYVPALYFFDGDKSLSPYYIVFLWICLAGLLLLIHIIRGTIRFIKYLKEVSVKILTGRSLRRSLSSMMKCLSKLQRRLPV